MSNKALLGGLSAVLLVAAVIGTVAVVNRSSNTAGGDSSLSATSKSIRTFCAPTDYREICESKLTNVLSNSTSGSVPPEEIVQATIKAIINEVQSALQHRSEVSKNAPEGINQMALEDCRQLILDAKEDLEELLQYAHDLNELLVRTDDIKAWLTAVISYQASCVDGIPQQELRDEMSNGLWNVTQLTVNAIAIMKQIEPVLKSLKIDVDLPSIAAGGSNRRLLYDRDDKGYPQWLSVADRKLLQAQDNVTVTPNVVVAQDGSGDFKSIQEAVQAVPKKHEGRYVIYVKAGLYKEYVNITKYQKDIFMYGDGWNKTVVTGSRNFLVDNITTINTATVTAAGDGFICKDMGFINTAGPEKGQAVALRVQSDFSVIYNCRIDGYQDTLYAHGKRQFYSNCIISGTVNFIFGYATAVFQDCLILPRRPLDRQTNAITAHGRNFSYETSGYTIQNCRIEPHADLEAERLQIPTYLGRPWKPYSRVVVIESTIGDLVRPTGWEPWDGGNGTLNTENCFYAEYGNTGPGANTIGRVTWKGYHSSFTREEAEQYTVDGLFHGSQWIPSASVPFLAGLKN